MNDPSFMAPLQAFPGLKPPAPTSSSARTLRSRSGHSSRSRARRSSCSPGANAAGRASCSCMAAPPMPTGGRSSRHSSPASVASSRSSFTGMGRSGWRDAYVFDQLVREAREAGRKGGAFDAGPPVVVGHWFGGRVAVGLAHHFGDELSGAVMVDPPIFAPQNRRPPSPPRPTRERRIQHSLEAVVARFRLAPPQACDNLFILDFIARRSVARGPHEGQERLGLVFRSALLGEVHPHRSDFAHRDRALAGRARPRREVSALPAGGAAYLLGLMPPGAPYVEIPEAEHHVMIDQPLAFVAALEGAAGGVAGGRRRREPVPQGDREVGRLGCQNVAVMSFNGAPDGNPHGGYKLHDHVRDLRRDAAKHLLEIRVERSDMPLVPAGTLAPVSARPKARS